jgi:3-deoxy-D-manno-octulosonic-acid transferase
VDLCLAQSSADAERFLRLGARDVRIVGNLKYDAPAPPVDQAELARLAGAIGPRPVWIAASTHDGEEAIALSVHRRLQARFPNLLTIIAPRHPERGALVAELAARHSLVCSRRSIGGSVEPSTQVYVSDTIGEAGLYYRLASIVFIGKSLAGGGGQNPIEPAKLGGVVLHGPHVGNFDDVYGDLDARGGAHRVEDEAGLAAQVGHLLADPARLRRMARAGAESVERFAGAADATLQALSPWLAERAPDAA